jgi:hypothetical protein
MQDPFDRYRPKKLQQQYLQKEYEELKKKVSNQRNDSYDPYRPNKLQEKYLKREDPFDPYSSTKLQEKYLQGGTKDLNKKASEKNRAYMQAVPNAEYIHQRAKNRVLRQITEANEDRVFDEAGRPLSPEEKEALLKRLRKEYEALEKEWRNRNR